MPRKPPAFPPEKRYSKRFRKVRPFDWKIQVGKETEKFYKALEEFRINNMLESRGLSFSELYRIEDATDVAWWKIPGNTTAELFEKAELFGYLERTLYAIQKSESRIKDVLRKVGHPSYTF